MGMEVGEREHLGDVQEEREWEVGSNIIKIHCIYI